MINNPSIYNQIDFFFFVRKKREKMELTTESNTTKMENRLFIYLFSTKIR